jgi:hypothetical protein
MHYFEVLLCNGFLRLGYLSTILKCSYVTVYLRLACMISYVTSLVGLEK